LIAVDEDAVPCGQPLMNEPEGRIYDLLADVRGVVYVHEVQDQPRASASDKVLRVVFRDGPASIGQCLAMIWLLASMNNPPTGLGFLTQVVLHARLVIALAPDVKVRDDLDHCHLP
jgi:hypothetical protein